MSSNTLSLQTADMAIFITLSSCVLRCCRCVVQSRLYCTAIKSCEITMRRLVRGSLTVSMSLFACRMSHSSSLILCTAAINNCAGLSFTKHVCNACTASECVWAKRCQMCCVHDAQHAATHWSGIPQMGQRLATRRNTLPALESCHACQLWLKGKRGRRLLVVVAATSLARAGAQQTAAKPCCLQGARSLLSPQSIALLLLLYEQ